jgi:hypothetical protein
MKIIIISYKRPDFHNAPSYPLCYKNPERWPNESHYNTTLQWTDYLRDNSVLFIREEEKEDYKGASDYLGIPIETISFKERAGWGDTMDAVMERYKDTEDMIAIIPDDINIRTSKDLTDNPDKDFLLLNGLSDCIKKGFRMCDYDHPFISFAKTKQRVTPDNFFIFNCKYIRDNPWFRFRTGSDLKGPFYCSASFLALLYHRHTNKFYDFIPKYNLYHYLGSPGGCDSLGRRSITEHEECCRYICSCFPEETRLIENISMPHISDNPSLVVWYKDWFLEELLKYRGGDSKLNLDYWQVNNGT